MAEMENLNRPNREESDFELKHFLMRYLGYWYVFVICLIVTFAFAKFYNWYTNPVFAVTAKLLVKDENVGKEKLLQQLNVDKPTKNIENEIEILRSFNLISHALNELEFDVSYYLVGDLKKSEVYKDCPFRLTSEQLEFRAYALAFDVRIIDSLSFNFRFDDGNQIREVTGYFGQPLEMGLGRVTLNKRENFPTELIGNPTFDKRNYQVRFNTIATNQHRYLSRLSIGMARAQSTILQIYLEDEVPQKGLDFVNKLIEVYLSNDIDTKNKAASATGDFLDGQLLSITEDLERIETNRERYKVSKGIIDLESESQIVLESIRSVDTEKSVNTARLSLINQLEDYVVESQDLRDLAPAALDISDPLLIKLINKLSELQSQREIIIKRSTANDPSLIPLNAEIELTRTSLLENIRNIRKGLGRKDVELNEAIRSYRSRIQQIPTTERELLEIERRFRIQESLYLFLLQKRAELSISLAATESDTRLIDSARLTPGPISPVPERAYTIALILGLLIPTAFIFGIEKFNDKVENIGLLRKLTSIPLLGVVRLSTQDSPLVAFAKPQSAIAEEYRSIRTNLNFFNVDTPVKVIMVTSSIGTEGKTFTAMNLASVIAASGMRTVLVGLDLRKPRIVQDFGISNDMGCSNYLSGNASVEEIIQPSGLIDMLSIIPSGPTPPNPSELILSGKMADLIDELSQRFDKIVIDTPPVGLVSDGLMLSKFANLTLFVVRDGVTRKDHVRQIEEMYTNGQVQNVGIIFNAAKNRNQRYGYAQGYGYTYGYSSDYGDYFDEVKRSGGVKGFVNRFRKND